MISAELITKLTRPRKPTKKKMSPETGRRKSRLIAEKVLSKSLPDFSIVHHVDSDNCNIENNNLVICEDQEYHKFLHQRLDALKACGNKNWCRCTYCGVYADPNTLISNGKGLAHSKCKSEYLFSWRRRSSKIV